MFGQRLKPTDCFECCPLAYQNMGFVSDSISEHNKIVVIQALPGKGDLAEREAGNSGLAKWFLSTICKGLYTPSEVGWASLIRCYGDFPVGANLSARTVCRRYDNHQRVQGTDNIELREGGLFDWSPNVFFVTFEISKARELAAIQFLVEETIRKAKSFQEAGYRPAILLGKEVFTYLRPDLKEETGHKGWYGHWWEGTWQRQEKKGSLISVFKPLQAIPQKKQKMKKEPNAKQLSLFEES